MQPASGRAALETLGVPSMDDFPATPLGWAKLDQAAAHWMVGDLLVHQPRPLALDQRTRPTKVV